MEVFDKSHDYLGKSILGRGKRKEQIKKHKEVTAQGRGGRGKWKAMRSERP